MPYYNGQAFIVGSLLKVFYPFNTSWQREQKVLVLDPVANSWTEEALPGENCKAEKFMPGAKFGLKFYRRK